MGKICIKATKESGEFPAYATDGSADMDLRASEPALLPVGKCVLVRTGLRMALPKGYEAQIRSRSGLALKHMVCVFNAPGTIDSDYRGEVGVILYNAGAADYEVKTGDRIAQMVIAQYTQAGFEEAQLLDDTVRGAGGFGHTGK